MKSAAAFALLIVHGSLLLTPRSAMAQPATPSGATACTPSGDLHYVCGLINVEDFLPVAGGRWLVGSSYKAGSVGLYLIDTAAKTAQSVALSVAAARDPLYGDCAAPDLKALETHGLDVAVRGGATLVYAVNHGGRESVEVFRLNAPKVSAEWLGCVVMPTGAVGNSVAAVRGGGFVVTKFLDSRDKDSFQHILAGQVNGVTYQWTPGKGFSEVPGTQLSGDNGVVVSPDGKWLYVNAYGTLEIYRVPLTGKGERSSVKVDFHPDNLRWAPDGTIFVTGQFLDAKSLNGPHGWATVRLDPNTMTTTAVVKEPGRPEFDDATSAVQAGKSLWFGTFRGDRVAYRAVP
jgi:hypothetical protein